MTRHDLGTFQGSAAARLLRSHQADARYTAGGFTALCITILALIFAAAAQVGPAVV